jgi:signal transduction histidine kinase
MSSIELSGAGELARAQGRPVVRFFGVLWRPRTYLNLSYVLAAFPLGTAYFTYLVTILSTGLSLLGVLIGVPITVFAIVSWWWLAAFERQLAISMLGVEIGPMAPPIASGLSMWQRLLAHLRRRVTWSSLLFLFVKFPLSLFGWIVEFVLIAASFALIASPLPFLVGWLTDGTMPPDRVALALMTPLLMLLGVVLLALTLHAANGIAWISGRFAATTLGLSDTAMRLAEARAVAARAQATAVRAEQSRRELIVNVSHELRTPIASIRGHVDSLLMAGDETGTAASPEELRNYLGIVARESERLGLLVDDLMALARADAGELRLDVHPVVAGEVVEEVYGALQPLAKRDRKVSLVRDVPSGLPLVLADRQRLGQVLLNLVRNAITYTPAGGIVSLSVAQVSPYHLVFAVADTGVGIPPEEIARVFERFYRTDASRARESGGFGLGLAISRDLVQAMGGTITAESTPGEGSRFLVYLRVAPPPYPAP